MSKLKPCPFCGGKARLGQAGFNYDLYYVECTNPECDAMPTLRYQPLKRYAIDAWNNRYEGGDKK